MRDLIERIEAGQKVEAQEIFDFAFEAVFRQGAPSTLAGLEATCAYRGEYGRRCVVGHLIPDSAYSASMEGHVVGRLSEMGCLPWPLERHRTLLGDLQSAHDGSSDLSGEGFLPGFAAKARMAAGKHGLSVAVIDRLAGARDE